jgi:hypothetical protein
MLQQLRVACGNLLKYPAEETAEQRSSGPEKKKRVVGVSSISLPLHPKGRNGLVLAPWSGAPNQSMVGGPPSHSAIKRGWGPRLAV